MTKFSVRSFVVNVLGLLFAASAASAQTLPSGWSTKDIGAVAAVGAATSVNNIFAVSGSGRDVWGAADEFRFVYKSLTGDGSIVAQVTTLDMVDLWVKGGVMMRESLNANSRHASMFVSAGKGLAFQRRTTTGGTSTHSTGGASGAPYYVRMTRAGSTFTAYKSVDGVTWTKVGSTSMTMAPTIYVGLAVTSHLDGTLATGTFAHVNVAAAPVSVADPAPTSITTTGSTTLRVLHWNTRHGRDLANRRNLDGLTTAMAARNPDVVTLNEVEKYVSSYGNEDQPRKYAELLTAKTGKRWYYHFAQRYGNWTSNGQGNVLLSRYRIISTASIELACDRSAAVATLDVNGKLVTVLTTHLDNESSSCRNPQISEIRAAMKGFAGVDIVTGDWNATPRTSEYSGMLDAYLDAWRAAPTRIDIPGNNEAGATYKTLRIDYVFPEKSSAVAVSRVEVFTARASDGVKLSDHNATMATLTLR